MPSTTAGWLVLGTGRHVDRYGLPALARCRTGSAVAVYGSDPGRTAELAARHAVPHTSRSLDDLLTDPAVTHVYVCSANSVHEEQVRRAADAGKQVLCEKPLAPTMDAAARMVDHCRERGVLLGTGFHLRHNAAHSMARTLIAGGEIGEPLEVRADYLHVIAPGDGTARLATSRVTTGPSKGAMAGTGAHAVDLVRYLLDDDLPAVSAHLVERDDDATTGPQRLLQVTGTTARAAMVAVTAGRAAFPVNGVSVLGTAGHIAISGSIGNQGGGLLRVRTSFGEREVVVDPHDVYAEQFDAFVDAGARGAAPSASGVDGLAALLIADAVDQSLSRDGSRVEIADVASDITTPATREGVS